jgi:hypothetical protein
MNKLTLVSSGPNPDWAHQPATADHPVEIFYVVLSKGSLGERDHRLCSALYENLALAEVERARLRAADLGGNYSVWKSSTYIEPGEWLHRVVRSDGTLIMPRLRGVETFGER